MRRTFIYIPSTAESLNTYEFLLSSSAFIGTTQQHQAVFFIEAGSANSVSLPAFYGTPVITQENQDPLGNGSRLFDKYTYPAWFVVNPSSGPGSGAPSSRADNFTLEATDTAWIGFQLFTQPFANEPGFDSGGRVRVAQTGPFVNYLEYSLDFSFPPFEETVYAYRSINNNQVLTETTGGGSPITWVQNPV